MKKSAPKIIISLVCFLISGLLVYAASQANSKAASLDQANQSFQVLTGPLQTEGSFIPCIQGQAETCYTWQYVKGTISNDALTIMGQHYSLSNYSNYIYTLNPNLEASVMLSEPSSDGKGQVITLADDTQVKQVSSQDSLCVEGKYVYFNQVPANISYQSFKLEDNKGYILLYKCAGDNSPDRLSIIDYFEFNFIK